MFLSISIIKKMAMSWSIMGFKSTEIVFVINQYNKMSIFWEKIPIFRYLLFLRNIRIKHKKIEVGK